MTDRLRPEWANLSIGETGIDKECLALCEALNLLPDIETTESCCGHDIKPFKIWFRSKTLESLPPLLYFFDGCHCGSYEWSVTVSTDCAMSPVVFRIQGPIGEKAYQESAAIAKLLAEWVNTQDQARLIGETKP